MHFWFVIAMMNSMTAFVHLWFGRTTEAFMWFTMAIAALTRSELYELIKEHKTKTSYLQQQINLLRQQQPLDFLE